MKLVASAIVRNEIGRYLEPWLDHLVDFCDEVRLIDDWSTDHTAVRITDYVADGKPVTGMYRHDHSFDQHEGRARQELLDWTLEAKPTHVLAIDADEFITDGARLREILMTSPSSHRAWSLPMREIWEVGDDGLCQREDGGWRAHKTPLLWKVPSVFDRTWRIDDKALACGRIPTAVRDMRSALVDEVSILHFGWANEAERQARYDRYMSIDGGAFHARSHLRSIMDPCSRIRLVAHSWPETLAPYREAITTAALKQPAA